ncbi:MAG TPA: hypothetical protein VKQ11_07355 [Candidatus Sulfotelmatobacter sp.]|nr:hypothetical protein [Candidatus Sulfotelmatobacter sp.]
MLSGTANLSLPQNRIAVASTAFPVLWKRNEPQARTLVNQMIGDFAQAAAAQQEDSEPQDRQMLRQQWQTVLREIAPCDAELALSFMNSTRTFVQIGDAEQQEAEERSLRLEFAAQEAEHSPRNAMRLAEKELQAPGDLNPELINLLSQISAKDPQAGTQLLHEIVDRVRSGKLSSGEDNFNFALNLLNLETNSQTNGGAPDDTVKTLADAVAVAALNPEFPATSLPMLQGALPAFEQFDPGRVQALRQKVEEFIRVQNPQQRSWDQFNQAVQSGDPNQLLALAEQAPPDVRPSMVQQVAWQFANNGDVPRVRQMMEKLTDPFQRQQVLQQAARQSLWSAANQGDFAAARQLAQEITSDGDRATILAQLAVNAATAKQDSLAQAMLEEAAGLLVNTGAGASAFAAQLQVAQAFAHVKPDRAVPLLERSASQLDQVLTAAAEIDAFLPYQHSFESGELILSNSVLCNSLVRPYADAIAQLANTDFPAARILADRLPLPEARLFTELFLATSALSGENNPPAVVSVNMGRFSSWGRY